MKERGPQLQVAWKAAHYNAANRRWQQLHEGVVKEWRRQGDAPPDHSSPAGFDAFCRKVSKLRNTP